MIEQDGQSPVVADPNVVILYNPEQDYARYEVDRRGDHCAWYAMPEEVMAVALSDGRFNSTHVAVEAGAYLHHRLIVDYLRRATSPDPLLVEEAAMSVVDRVVRGIATSTGSGKRDATTARHEALVRDAQLLMAHNYRMAMDLTSIAREVGSSPYHLARVFRRLTGRTIHRHLMQLRLRSALVDLLATTADLASIAHDSGLSSHSHLSRMFTDQFSTPPSRIRLIAHVEEQLRKIVKA